MAASAPDESSVTRAAASPRGAPPPERKPAVPEDEDVFALRLDWRRWWTILPEIVALACAGLLPAVVGASVLSRYTYLFRVLWAEDVVKVLFLWLVFLGGALGVKYGSHVRMSMLSDRLARMGRAGVLWEHVIHLSPVVLGAMLLILGVQIVGISMRRELPMLQISAGYFTTVIPASGALMIFYAVRGWWTRRRGESDAGAYRGTAS